VATTLVYSNADDGYLFSDGDTYADARTGTGKAADVGANTTSLLVGQAVPVGTFSIYSAHVAFSLSAIPAGDAVTSSWFDFAVNSDQSLTDFTINVRGYDWTPGGLTFAGDWQTSPTSFTRYAFKSTSGITTGSYGGAFSNDGSNLRSAIDAARAGSGVLAASLYSSRFESNTAPTLDEYVGISSADTSGTSLDPRLTVNHSPVQELAGDVEDVAEATGTLSGDYTVDGDAESVAELRGTASGDLSVTGTASSTSETTGAASVELAVDGATDATSDLAGQVGLDLAGDGTVDAATDVTGDAVVDLGIDGATDTAGSLEGTLSGDLQLFARSSTAAALTGVLTDAPKVQAPTDLLSFVEGRRSARVEYAYVIVNDRGQPKAMVHPLGTPTITGSSNARIARTLTGLTLRDSDARRLSWVTDRIQPWMLIDGVPYVLGTFAFTEPRAQRSALGTVWEVSAHDLGFLFEQTWERTYGVPRGTGVITTFRSLFLALGVPVDVDTNLQELITSEPLAWPVGSPISTTTDDLARKLSAATPWFNRYARAQVKRLPYAQFGRPDVTFPKPVDGTVVEGNDLWNKANTWICTSRGEVASVAGRWDLPDDHPMSYVKRRYRHVRTVDEPGLGTVEACIARARDEAQRDLSVHETVQFDTISRPDLEPNQIALYAGTRLLLEGWRHPLDPGAYTTVNLRESLRITRYDADVEVASDKRSMGA
jgi:hypothetical protein